MRSKRLKIEMKKKYIFINGILTDPGDVEGWTDNAEAWIERETPFKADKFEYRAGAATRRILQNSRVDNVITIARRMGTSDLVLVGHSNGCDIIERVVRKANFRIRELHLIAAASEHDFEKNGFNKALQAEKVGKIFIYCSPKDRALKKAKFTRGFLKFIGLGYGYLGLVGPSRVRDSLKDRVITHWTEFDHSEWFTRRNFEQTMKLITLSTPMQ